MTSLAAIKQLIADFAQADADHDAVFDEVGPEADEKCSDALDAKDEAFLAVCRARPDDDEGKRARRAFLDANLLDQTLDRPVYRRNVFMALEGGSAEAPSTDGRLS
ncbi:MAG: hypothetical protein LCH99_29560 [Proteobacteria bacterium]|nr:hypothetical protein [Pseudomonadota bacterium]